MNRLQQLAAPIRDEAGASGPAVDAIRERVARRRRTRRRTRGLAASLAAVAALVAVAPSVIDGPDGEVRTHVAESSPGDDDGRREDEAPTAEPVPDPPALADDRPVRLEVSPSETDHTDGVEVEVSLVNDSSETISYDQYDTVVIWRWDGASWTEFAIGYALLLDPNTEVVYPMVAYPPVTLEPGASRRLVEFSISPDAHMRAGSPNDPFFAGWYELRFGVPAGMDPATAPPPLAVGRLHITASDARPDPPPAETSADAPIRFTLDPSEVAGVDEPLDLSIENTGSEPVEVGKLAIYRWNGGGWVFFAWLLGSLAPTDGIVVADQMNWMGGSGWLDGSLSGATTIEPGRSVRWELTMRASPVNSAPPMDCVAGTEPGVASCTPPPGWYEFRIAPPGEQSDLMDSAAASEDVGLPISVADRARIHLLED